MECLHRSPLPSHVRPPSRAGARRRLARAVALLLAAAWLTWLGPATAGAAGREFQFHHDDVLGTSLDLTVVAEDAREAEAARQAAVAEVRRLDGILNTYDPHSEIRRLCSAKAAAKCSPELVEVLRACEAWRKRSGGAFNENLGELIGLWKQAAGAGTLPDRRRLATVVGRVNKPAWEIRADAGTVSWTGPGLPNVDGLAKGFIVDRAVVAAREKSPRVAGLLVDIGGDIRAWGRPASAAKAGWVIGVADPKRSHDNASPMARVAVSDGSVATSGNYARYYEIGGKKYSHILDPRTGMPAGGVISSTAVARNCADADALATALSVLPPREGLKLVEATADAACLIVAADGKQYRSTGWKTLELPGPAPQVVQPLPPAPPPAPPAWPAGYQVELKLKIHRSFWRPPLAIWVEDASGKCVRTLAVWGKLKYLPSLRTWWRFAGKDVAAVKAISRATRPGGTYELIWDGKDNRRKPLPPGAYTVRLEVTPDGKKSYLFAGKIDCGTKPAKVAVAGKWSAKLAYLNIAYGPAGK